VTRVLIVDDQEQNRYLLEIMLRAQGYVVQSARNGIEALEMACSEAPDLIITDILMPGMDGFSLCREWMADPRLRHVPLVFYTATYTDPKDEAFALSLGAARFVVKPTELEAFIEIIRQVLENHTAQRLVPHDESSPADEPFYQQYNQALIRKLEAKMAQLEAVNRALERDVAERKRAEAERERLLAQVQAQAEQIIQIMNTVPEGVLLLDADSQVLLANPAGERDLAALASATVGTRLTHLGDLPLVELFASAERSGSWHEVRAGQRIFEAIARPVVTSSPAMRNWVLLINDATRARHLRDQLQQQERLAAVGQLAAGIAHDFNNILTIIALQAPLLARAAGLTERDRERLAIISQQTDHATRLIQQLLDFSRRAALERRPLDLGPLLKEQVKLLTHTLPETIQVTLACAPGEYVVLADPTRLQQMLVNLAINARDAMPAGGTLRLTLAQQGAAPRPNLPAGPWIRLEVADSGTGIASEALPHLFEPFFTTKPRGQGTGLGLAQIHGIVKQHEGEIEVQSVVGQGTTFTIYLPAAAAAASEPAPALTAPQIGAEQMILIVEDNPTLRDAMCDIVEMLGYRVIGAGNGAEALAVLAEHGDAIALILSDLIMPVMGGEALFRAIRARGLTTPVVMLSGHPLEGELAGLKEQGLVGWLLKPPMPDDLARLLAQALNASHA